MESMSYQEFAQDARIATLEAAIELLWNEVAYNKGAVNELREYAGDTDHNHCSCH